MLLFLAFLYTFLLMEGLFSSKNHETLLAKNESRVTARELKKKEEIVRQNLMARPKLAGAIWLSFIAVLASGIGLDAYLVLCGFRDRPWEVESSKKPWVRWGLKEITQGFVFLFFVEGVIFVAQTFWYWATGLEKTPRDFFLLANSLLRDLCVVFFVWRLVRGHGQSLADLGLKSGRFVQNVKTGVLGYVAMVPPMLVGFVLLAALMHLFSYQPLPQNVVQIYLEKKNTGHYLFLFTLFVAGLGPVLEELFFRGFAYPALKQRIGTAKAMALTAAVFAGFHMSALAFLPVFFLGLFLTYLYESTGSLVPSISAHVLHNTLMVLMTLGFRALSGS